jgi:DNA-binding XRE family transcriptional regulator
MDISPIRLKRASELRSFRKEVGITQEQLAVKSGLTRATVIAIEKGTIGWNVDSEILYFETLKQWNKQ